MIPVLIEMEMIAVEDVRGAGTPEDPHRSIASWYSTDGTLLLSFDPMSGETFGAINMMHFLRAVTVHRQAVIRSEQP